MLPYGFKTFLIMAISVICLYFVGVVSYAIGYERGKEVVSLIEK